ncbi:MAG: patatin family protein [Ruminococcus sp.]|jgi:predicted patatin/cPLA2 family phospholipase|nr:patatin family protein [Ruminococcus sp.]
MNKKTGLVLEGGAMRGIFTAGVTDIMMENGIDFDGVIGVSAGAAFGCNYKSKQNGRAIRYNLKFCNDKRFCSVQSLIKTGDMFGAEFCYHELPSKHDIFDTKTFEENPQEFYVVCTDVITGKPVYKRLDKAEYNDLEWIRASASMPLASRIVEIDGYKLLDGGISDSIPLAYFQKIGYEKCVVILTQPKGYIKTPSKSIYAAKLMLRKYPELIKTLENRPEVYNKQVKYIRNEEKKGNVFVIAPEEKLPVNRVEHDADKLRAVYEIGRKIGKNRLNDLKAFLEK